MSRRHSPLPIPLVAMQNNALILGKPGAGKSALARLIFEAEIDTGHRATFIDPMGDAAGIRLTPQGKPSRFKDVVIMGGPHADIPIAEEDGPKCGKFVAQSRSSFLIDLSGLLASEQSRFMGGFADQLYENMAVPTLLLVDEAHLFAPQQRGDGEASSYLINRMVRLNSQGRKRGIFLWLMTQRPARISKNIIAGTETLIAMKMTTPRDIDAMEEWLSAHDSGQGREAKTAVPKLKVGEAIVWSPGADFFSQVQFPFHTTFDSGRTPMHGETIGKINIPKVTDLAEIAKAFGITTTGDARDETIAALRADLSSARDSLSRERAERARIGGELAAVTVRETNLLNMIIAIQNRIGAAIGSPPIVALPIMEPYEKYLMVEGPDGIVRPMPRTGDNTSLIAGARGRMKSAIAPDQAPPAKPAAKKKPAISPRPKRKT
jgi:uncharacterized protein